MIQEEVVVVHSCNQTETLKHLAENTKKLSEIITGNGHPEDGICRKVALIGERQGVMVEKLQEIHVDLSNYHKDVQEAKDVAFTVKSAFEKYQASIEGEEKGKDKASTASQVNFNNIISIIGTIVIIAGLVYSVLSSRRADGVLKDKINSLGTPVIVNDRGAVVSLPEGDSLKFFRDGEFKSTIKDRQEARK